MFPNNVREQRLAAERALDAVLADSFPASDPPPWTLGVSLRRERGEDSEVSELLKRIEAEYVEMPGLSLTLPQAQRLWTADRHTCQRVFDRLIARGAVRMTVRGRFVRA